MQKPKSDPKIKNHTYNSTDTILMIRPSNFGSNPQTLADNAFQSPNTDKNQQVKQIALNEFDYFVATLKKQGINVITVQDTKDPAKPDAIFPNNWFGTLKDGRVVIYPMKPVSRRLQKKNPVIDNLKQLGYQIKSIVDWSKYQQQKNQQNKTGIGKFLQGTGSMLLDHQNKIAYACKSQRTNQQLFQKFCKQILNYRSIFFQAFDAKNTPYYHTNVIMSICSDFVIICLQSITNQQQKQQIIIAIKQSQSSSNDENKTKQIIDIKRQQVNRFCGNVLQVHNQNGDKFLVMSTSAFDGFTQDQIKIIQKYCKIIKVDVPCIQTYGGGGTRCTMAEIFLKKKEHKDGKDKEGHQNKQSKQHKQTKQGNQVKETKQVKQNKESKDNKQTHDNKTTENKQVKQQSKEKINQ